MNKENNKEIVITFLIILVGIVLAIIEKNNVLLNLISIFLLIIFKVKNEMIFEYLQKNIKNNLKNFEKINYKINLINKIINVVIIVLQLIIGIIIPQTLIYFLAYYNYNNYYMLTGFILLIDSFFVNSNKENHIKFISIFIYILSVLSIYFIKKIEKLEKELEEEKTNKNKNEIQNENMKRILTRTYELEKQNLLKQDRSEILLEIHDEVGHKIASSIMILETLENNEKDKLKKENIFLVKEQLKTVIENIRSIVHKEIKIKNIKDELEKISNEFTNIKTNLNISINNNVDYEKLLNITFITKELFTNTSKYSKNEKIIVNLEFLELEEYYIFKYNELNQENNLNENYDIEFKNSNLSNVVLNEKVGVGIYSIKLRCNKMNAYLQIDENYNVYIRIPKIS